MAGGRSAVLNVRIVSDAAKASEGFDQAASRVERFEAGLDRASVAAAGALAAMGALAAQAFEAASALEQSSGAVESVFGANSAAVQELAAAAAQAVGLSKNAYQEVAAVLGSQLQSMGYAGSDAIDTMDSLINVAADLSATFGGTTQEAIDAISSALRGERDPIERYAIALSQAGIDAEIAARGLDTSTFAAERAATAQATLGMIMEQASNAQGAFAREADTAAGQLQRASAEAENAKASLGEALLPVVADVSQALAGMAGWLGQNTEIVTPLVLVVAGLATAILLVNGAMKAFAAIQVIVNAVTAASPLFLLVAVIAAIVAAVVLMYDKFDWFRDLLDSIGRGFRNVWDFVGRFFAAFGIGEAPASRSAPAASAPVAAAGLYGAAAGMAPVRGAALGAGTGGGLGPAAGAGLGPSTVVNVTVNGAVDPVATGRQIDRAVRRYSTASGGRSTGRAG